MHETVFQYRVRLIRSFFRLGCGYLNPWSHFFLHPIVFELWDSFHQNIEDQVSIDESPDVDTLMAFADDAACPVRDDSSAGADVDLEQEELLLAAQCRTKRRLEKAVGFYCNY